MEKRKTDVESHFKYVTRHKEVTYSQGCKRMQERGDKFKASVTLLKIGTGGDTFTHISEGRQLQVMMLPFESYGKTAVS